MKRQTWSGWVKASWVWAVVETGCVEARRKGHSSHLGSICFVAFVVVPAVSGGGQATQWGGCVRDMAVDNFPTKTRVLSSPVPAGRGSSESHVLGESPLSFTSGK